MQGSHGWSHVSGERKREIIDAIVSGEATRGPVHAELDLTDRCNVACYFCNQQDLRTKEQIPLPKTMELIDELAETGLKSVRLSGGGDPLFHREILQVLDHLASRGVIVDNLTTNAVAMGPEVNRRLIENKAREVIVSLNAADPADYARMMQVKASLYDRVIENVKDLIARRGDSIYPSVVMQYLIDRENFQKLPQMYDAARACGVDRIAINPVLEIPRERIKRDLMLAPDDREAIRPFLEETLRKDVDAGLLQIYFPHNDWNVMLEEIRQKVGHPETKGFSTASSFKEENSACFFSWYTVNIRGNGDLHGCCLLMNPDYATLGNTMNSKIADHWNGPVFKRYRQEQRDVLLTKGQIEYRPERFQILKKQCVEAHLCWLKNMYFRGDEEFYKELGEALEGARKKEVRWIGSPQQISRAAEMLASRNERFRKYYDKFRRRSRGARFWIRNKLGISGFTN